MSNTSTSSVIALPLREIALKAPAVRQPGRRRPRVLAVASGGGHWVQLLRLAPAFVGCDLAFVTVHPTARSQIPFANARFHVVNDATRWDKLGLARMMLRLLRIVLRERPDIVISTGAAPGYFAIMLGKMLCGARTIWVDSIANVECLSLSGQKVGRWADLWLTQWPHLAQPGGPHYAGAVL
ncbi:UDP-N-acetylglucosamine--LPS N-acetylglucosamine transferase [Fontivita pretiosa]|uniref:UDP-N-acetylglucosamine--LPS N-acetylglucosamine transferase n=1 Tax=Fontivita pretiosa TaxID=2989684 RepID=UPI003D166274